jgi:bifunctional non-homologous end joining protein LigD
LLAIGRGEARTYTRSGLDCSDKFAPLIKAAKDLKVTSALVDGEAVVHDGNGKTNF